MKSPKSEIWGNHMWHSGMCCLYSEKSKLKFLPETLPKKQNQDELKTYKWIAKFLIFKKTDLKIINRLLNPGFL